MLWVVGEGTDLRTVWEGISASLRVDIGILLIIFSHFRSHHTDDYTYKLQNKKTSNVPKGR